MTRRSASRAKLLPAAQGYRMPAEWEPHESTWLAWPHFRGDWPGKFEPIPWVYAEIVRNLARHERVDLIVNTLTAERRARAVLEQADALSDNVCFHRWRTDRVWTRDSGCIFLTPPTNHADFGLLALHFQFNGWAKYPNYKFDEKIGARMAKAAGARVVRPVSGDHRVVLEGGSIDVNGCGTLITTEECLLSTTQQRNLAHGPRRLRADCSPTILARSPSSGSTAALPATTLMATSMTSPASSLPIPWSR